MGYKQRLEKLETIGGGIVEPMGVIEHILDGWRREYGEYSVSISPGARNAMSKRYPSPGYAYWHTNSEADARSILAEKAAGYGKSLHVLFMTSSEAIEDRWIAWVKAGKPGGIEATPHGEQWYEYLMPDGKWRREAQGMTG